MTTEYLNSRESFEALVLSNFIARKNKGRLNVRVYNILKEEDYAKQYSFNSFVRDVLSYSSPKAYIMDKRNAGDVVADFFNLDFPEYLYIYNKYNRKQTNVSATFTAYYRYVTV